MEQTAKAKVPFTRANAYSCICWDCPVQASSQCVKENTAKTGNVMTTQFFEPQTVPALYCSSGVASCKDIDTKLDCLCPGCAVFIEYNLDQGQPVEYYCRDGKAR